jgi:PilZ domain-containing protein
MSPAPDAYPLTDRRRYPRTESPDDVQLAIPIVVHGDVIDISATGALISTAVPLKVGARVRLSLLLGREPFSAWVRVLRIEPGTGSERGVRYHLGVVFTAVDENNRSVLERFVRQDPPRPA